MRQKLPWVKPSIYSRVQVSLPLWTPSLPSRHNLFLFPVCTTEFYRYFNCTYHTMQVRIKFNMFHTLYRLTPSKLPSQCYIQSLSHHLCNNDFELLHEALASQNAKKLGKVWSQTSLNVRGILVIILVYDEKSLLFLPHLLVPLWIKSGHIHIETGNG